MDFEFNARSRFVPPMFFGTGSTVEPGDEVEISYVEARVRVVIETVDGPEMTGTVRELQDDVSRPKEHNGLAVGARVTLREEHVRSVWKSAAA